MRAGLIVTEDISEPDEFLRILVRLTGWAKSSSNQDCYYFNIESKDFVVWGLFLGFSLIALPNNV